MRLWFRRFLYDQDGALWALSRGLLESLLHQDNRLPQFAGQTLRGVEALIEAVDGKPVRLISVNGDFMQFDRLGRYEVDLRAAAEALAFSIDRDFDGDVVDLRKHFRQKRIARHRWKPTPSEITEIVHAIWPEQSGGKPKPKYLERSAIRLTSIRRS
jgi:hypothetical protein